MILLISYDLHAPGRDYSKLITAIKSYGGYCKMLESVWTIYTSSTPAQVRTHLMGFIDRNDSLLIVEFGKNWATYNVRKGATDWLNQPVAA